MQKNSGFVVAAAFAAALMTLVGCGANKPASGPVADKGPEWINKAGGAMKDNGQSVFYGVGIMQGVRNRALAVTGADERAKAEIAKIMNSYVKVLYKDYMNSTTAGDMTKSSEEQSVQQALQSFAKFTLHGAVVVDHWKDPADGTMFALAKLDMNAIKNSLADSKELDAKVRDYVKANAEKAFDELSAEDSKH